MSCLSDDFVVVILTRLPSMLLPKTAKALAAVASGLVAHGMQVHDSPGKTSAMFHDHGRDSHTATQVQAAQFAHPDTYQEQSQGQYFQATCSLCCHPVQTPWLFQQRSWQVRSRNRRPSSPAPPGREATDEKAVAPTMLPTFSFHAQNASHAGERRIAKPTTGATSLALHVSKH